MSFEQMLCDHKDVCNDDKSHRNLIVVSRFHNHIRDMDPVCDAELNLISNQETKVGCTSCTHPEN